MSNLAIPFNVSILQPNAETLRGLKPVTSLGTLEGATRNFDENGLFSVSIFGRVGDERRSRRFSYINIKISVFHPIIYKAIGQLKRYYLDILAGKMYAVWDSTINDFVKSTPIDGQTGYQFFIEHWRDIVFEQRPSDTREQNIQLIKKFADKALTDKVIVMPAGLRDIEIGSDGRIARDEINDLYIRLLALSNSIPMDAVKNNPEILNTPRNSIQLAFNEIYDLLERMVEGKKKLMMGKWASRKIFNGTRNVLTPVHAEGHDLGSPGNVGINDTIVGLYQLMKSALPVTKYHIKNGFLSKVFTGPHDPVNLVNKETWKTESIRLNPAYYASYMTDEGLEKVITAFSEESIRHKELEIEGRYVGLIYNDPQGRVKVFQDIDELPHEFDKQFVTPLTFCELMYLSVYTFANTLPAFFTRYPIAGAGSIYPSMVHLKPTVRTKIVHILNDRWEQDPNIPVAYDFPEKTDFVNSMSPASYHLAGLSADFDGDTGSLGVVYSEESIKEVKDYLASKRYYVGNDGKMIFSMAIDTVKFILKNMTGNPKHASL